jgi:hypothetical protein
VRAYVVQLDTGAESALLEAPAKKSKRRFGER